LISISDNWLLGNINATNFVCGFCILQFCWIYLLVLWDFLNITKLSPSNCGNFTFSFPIWIWIFTHILLFYLKL
jgi:hypothetical protein